MRSESVISPPPVALTQKAVHTLAASLETPEMPYLAFPAILDLGREVLVSFKHGFAHLADPDAVLRLLRFDPDAAEAPSQSILAEMKGFIMQMGEWVRFPNGDIANYIDAQQKAQPSRIGLRYVRSTDGGCSFGELDRVGTVDGVEYGYAFDSVTKGATTWMLVMTFANLAGGTLVKDTTSQPGSVDVIRTDDNGKSWHFVCSISNELEGAPINESSIIAHGDSFIIAARGYDDGQWLLRTDRDFKLTAKANLRRDHEFIKSYIGRPRLFTRDGAFYLLGRNWIDGGSMRLSLFRFDPDTLAVTRHFLLDNPESGEVIDGYYAQPYWRERGEATEFSVITYQRFKGHQPDIVLLSFDWDEVREA
jgi:hypothetical protein